MQFNVLSESSCRSSVEGGESPITSNQTSATPAHSATEEAMGIRNILCTHDGVLLKKASAEHIADFVIAEHIADFVSGSLSLVEYGPSKRLCIEWKPNENILIVEKNQIHDDWSMVDKIWQLMTISEFCNTKPMEMSTGSIKVRVMRTFLDDLSGIVVKQRRQTIQFIAKFDSTSHTEFFFQHGNAELFLSSLKKLVQAEEEYVILTTDTQKLKKTFVELDIGETNASSLIESGLPNKVVDLPSSLSENMAHKVPPKNRPDTFVVKDRQKSSPPSNNDELVGISCSTKTSETRSRASSLDKSPKMDSSANSAPINQFHDSTNHEGEVQISITSPQFSSNTAQNIHREFSSSMDANHQNTQPQPRPTKQELQNIVESTIRLTQVEIMSSVEEMLREIVPQIVAESLRSVSRSAGNLATLQPSPPQFDGQQPPLARGQLPNVFPNQTTGRPAFWLQPPPIRPEGQFNRSHSSHHMSNLPPPDNSTFPQYEMRPPYYQPPHNPEVSQTLELDKWGVTFDGTVKTMLVQDFVFRVEEMRKDYGYSWSDVLRRFHQLLSGDALEWYWMQRRLQPIYSWEELKKAVINRFRQFDSDIDIFRKIMDRRQLPQELFEDFFNAVLRLRNQQDNSINENDLVDIMMTNIQFSIARLVFPIRMFGLNHFRTECKKAESFLHSLKESQRPDHTAQ